MARVGLLVAIFLAFLTSSGAQAQILRCDIASKHRCDAAGGCVKVASSIWNIIDFPKQTLTRCDEKRCDTYPAQFAVSGAFINVVLLQNGLIAKMSSDGAIFMEVATLTGTALVSFGSCREQ